jgi:hypothetical protein
VQPHCFGLLSTPVEICYILNETCEGTMTIPSRCRLSPYAFAAALGLALLAAPAAQAFTIEDHSTSNPGGAARLYDQDGRASRFGSTNDGKTTIRDGNSTLQFGGQQRGDRYFNPDRMFEPNRPLTDR